MPSAFARSLRAAALALFLAACLGCYPGIAWLPDSSGFVYTAGKGKKQLRLFTLKTKKSRVLVADVGGPAWPAVSPDGKRIAVLVKEDKPDKEDKRKSHVWLTLSIFDRDGKRVHRSKPMRWREYGAVGGPDKGGLAQVAWSPKGDRLLLFQYDRTALYDLKTRKLLPLKGGLVTIGNSPVRPDGKGFLTASAVGSAFVDWDGKERRIKGGPPPEKRTDYDTESIHYFCSTHWKGAVALLHFEDGKPLGRIDTDKLTLEMPKEAPRLPRTKDGWVVLDSYSFPKGVTVRAASDKRPNRDRSHRLELLRPGAKTPEVLEKDRSDAPFKFFPSPDGKWLAVLMGKPELHTGRLLLFDARGEFARLNEPE
jgi:hypothetical protein